MARSLTEFEKVCLADEKEFMIDELRKCDYCTTSIEEHDRCWSEAARRSGERSRGCFC